MDTIDGGRTHHDPYIHTHKRVFIRYNTTKKYLAVLLPQRELEDVDPLPPLGIGVVDHVQLVALPVPRSLR